MKKKLFYLFSALMVVGIGIYSCGRSNSKNPKSVAESQNEDKMSKSSDETRAQYLVDTYSSALYELKAAEVAKTRAAHKNVKILADKIAKSNQKLNDQIKKLASSKNVSLPDDLTPNQHDKLQSMMEKKGSDFDKEFIDQMVSYYKDDVSKLEKVSNEENDPAFKTFASSSLPVVRGHLDTATTLQDHLKSSKK